MLRIGQVCILIITTIWSSITFASGFGELESWVGGYPVRESHGKSEKLLDNQHIKLLLHSLLSASDSKKLSDYDQSTQIQDIEGFIVINKCKPRNCAPERLIIVLDKQKERLWVGFFERKYSKVIVTWYGNVDDYSYIPNIILESFGEKR